MRDRKIPKHFHKIKKFIAPPRDWVKHPSLFDYLTEPVRVSIDLVEIDAIMNSGKSNIEKLYAIKKISSPYNKEDFEALRQNSISDKKEKQ